MTTTISRARWWTCRRTDDRWMLPATPVFLVAIDESPDLRSAGVRAVAMLLVALVVWSQGGGPGSRRLDRWALTGWATAYLLVGAWLASGLPTGGPPFVPALLAALGLAGGVLGWRVRRAGRPEMPGWTAVETGPVPWSQALIWLLCGAGVLLLCSEPPVLWIDAATIAVSVGLFAVLAGGRPASGACCG